MTYTIQLKSIFIWFFSCSFEAWIIGYLPDFFGSDNVPWPFVMPNYRAIDIQWYGDR